MSETYYTTVSHVSPMLTYIPGSHWTEPAPASDANSAQYWSQSYHSSSVAQARVLFSFFGTGVSVHGGYRRHLGPYKVILDGNLANPSSFSGFQTGDQENFDAILFSKSGLSPSYHQLEIINSSQDPLRPMLDINRIVYERKLPSPPQNVSCQNSRMKWSSGMSGSSSWTVSNSSGDTTSSVAHMGYDFYGTGISVYGTIHPASAPFFVAIDGWTSQLLYPNAQLEPATNEPQLLFSRSAMLPDNHTLIIRNNPVFSAGGSNVPNALSISHMVVFNVGGDGEPQQLEPLPNGEQEEPDGPSPGVEALEVVISVLLFVLLVAVACLAYRRKGILRRGLGERIRPFVLTPQPQMQERADPYNPPYEDPYDPSYQYVLVHNDKRSSSWTARTSPTLYVTDETRTLATMGRQRTLPKLPRLRILHPPPPSSSWHSRNRSSAALAASLLPQTGEEARSRGDENV